MRIALFPVAAVLCLVCPTEVAGQSFDTRITGVPAGFEDIAAPQKTVVDVYYGGRFLVSTLAEFSEQSIQFLAPREITSRIEGWVNPIEAADALEGPLPTHAEQRCARPFEDGCGVLHPSGIGVIFDIDRYQAEIFIAPDMLAAVDHSKPRYLPAGNSTQVTGVQNINLVLSGDAGHNVDSARYSLFGKTRVGMNDRFGFANLASTSNQGLLIDELGYHAGFGREYLEAGLFEFDPAVLRSADRDLLAGLRFGSDLKRMVNKEQIMSTPVDIFLNRRSRVSVFRDDRLIYAGFYEAGHQLLDTRRFPSGSYQIEIEIQDSAGITTREERLFVKSSLLPPPDHPLWSVAVGQTLQRANRQAFPSAKGSLQLRSSYRWRQTEWLGFGVAGAATETEAVGEFSGNIIQDTHSMGGEIYLGSTGAWGWSLRANARWSGGSLTVSSQTRTSATAAGTAPADGLLPDDLDNFSVFLSQRLGNTLLTGSWSSGSLSGVTRATRATLKVSRGIRIMRSHRATLTASLSRVDEDPQAGISIRWSGGLAGHRYGGAHEQVHFAERSSAPIVSTSAFSHWDGALADGSRWGANLNASAETAGEQLAVEGEYQGARGQTRAGLLHQFTAQDENTQFSLEHESSLVLGPDQTLGWGGARPAGAAVLVQTSGASEEAMDLVVNGRREFSMRPAQMAPLLLEPYQEYVVGVRDRGRSILRFTEGDQKVVLYPGDVKVLQWRADKMSVLLARVYTVRKHCLSGSALCMEWLEPLRDAAVSGTAEWARTTETGFLQAEVREGTPMLSAATGDGTCTMDLTQLRPTEGIVRAPVLVCRQLRR